MDAITLAAARTLLAHILDTLEEFVADDRLVTSLECLSTVGYFANVIRILEEAMPPLARDDALAVLAAGRRGQTKIGHRELKSVKRVIARRVQLESLTHKRRTQRVDSDGVDLATLEVGDDVEVADFGRSKSAAGFGLLVHLGLDVEALDGVDPSVHDVEHALHGDGIRALAEVLLG
nr:hypothetical protein [Tsukamurella tyrosinosolvens]